MRKNNYFYITLLIIILAINTGCGGGSGTSGGGDYSSFGQITIPTSSPSIEPSASPSESPTTSPSPSPSPSVSVSPSPSPSPSTSPTINPGPGPGPNPSPNPSSSPLYELTKTIIVDSPGYIAYGNNEYAVINTGNNTITIISTEGTIVRTITDVLFTNLMSIASNGVQWFIQNGNNIYRFDIDWTNGDTIKDKKSLDANSLFLPFVNAASLEAMDTSGIPQGFSPQSLADINNPTCIAIDKLNNVYITYNHGVRKSTIANKNIVYFGKQGSGNCEFLFPTGIHVDDAGYVYVVDSGNNRIQILKPDGTFYTKISIDGKPVGIVLDNNGNLCITISANNKILIYKKITL
jgi:sugar lactone lactonase YvrE